MKNWQYLNVGLSMVGAGLSAPTDSVGGMVAATVSPAIAYEIGQQFKANGSEGSAGHLLAHAVLGAAVAAAGGNNAMTGAIAAAGSEAIIPVVSQWLYGTKDPEQLTADQKDTLSSIASLVGAGTGALVGDGVADVVSGSGAGQNAVENNYLSEAQKKEKEKELKDCGNFFCDAQTHVKWALISGGQNASLAAGFVAGIPVALYEGVEGLVDMALHPIQTLKAMKEIFQQDDTLVYISDVVKQDYIKRIEKMTNEFEKAGASGLFNAGKEFGKLLTDVASILSGGAGIVKGGAALTGKVAAKVVGKGGKKIAKETTKPLNNHGSNDKTSATHDKNATKPMINPATSEVATEHVIVPSGRAPKTSTPNSIYEVSRADGSKSITYYDSNGNMFSREDYGQQKTHGQLGYDANGKVPPHKHKTTYKNYNGKIYKDKSYYREIDKNGKAVGPWILDKR